MAGQGELLSSQEIQDFFDRLGIGSEEERQKYREFAEPDPEDTKVVCIDNVTAPATADEESTS